MTITGERVSSPAGCFNPTFQRHVAAYRACAELLGPDGPVLDVGCGVGHSYRELAPRVTVGVDVDPVPLDGQERETHVADMRELPFPDGSFPAVVSIHSLEHVPDPERVVAEAARVLEPGGAAVLVTPNHLTFGWRGEIVDPYHYVEFDARALRKLCASRFATVRILGLHGSPRYLELVAAERRALDRVLSRDPLRLRRLIPRRARQVLYDWQLRRRRLNASPEAELITPEDFFLSEDRLGEALDLVAVCEVAA